MLLVCARRGIGEEVVTDADESRTRRAGKAAGRAAARASRAAVQRVRREAESSAFGRLVVVHGFSNAGDALMVIALSGTLFFQVPLDEARGRVALYLLLTMAPFSLLSPIAGPVLDRWGGARRLGIVIAGAGRAVVALYAAGHTDTLALYPAAFGLLVLSRVHAVARSAMVPSLDAAPVNNAPNLVARNARLSVVAVVAGSIAAGPGFALSGIWTGGAVLRAAAVCYVATAIFAWPLPSRERDPEEAVAGLAAFSTPMLVLASRAAAGMRAQYGFLLFILAFAMKQEGVSGLGFGFVLGAAGLGSFAASALTPRIERNGREIPTLIGALSLAVVAPLVALGPFELWRVGLSSGLTGAAATAARLAFESLVQREAPLAVRGRAFARYETLFQLAWVAGAGAAVGIPFGRTAGLAVGAAALSLSVGSFVLGRREVARGSARA